MAKPVATVAKGQRWLGYPNQEPRDRLFIEVRRVARDGSWADIFVCTWAVAWTKRMPLKRPDRFPFPSEPFDWDRSDLTAQMMDWERAHPDPQ